ncbi:MAG: ATP-binding protein [Proteobacteria bacterium]|nr:ATP-binding protein [Pseudomonadota bacterium]
MLSEQTIEKLYTMKLQAMAEAFREQLANPEMEELSFPERFGLVVDRQWSWREERRMQRLLQNAKLKSQACVEDIDYKSPRGIDKSTMMHLITCQWIRDHHNVIITGPTGVGKTYLACALAHKACREGLSTLYIRAPRLFYDLALFRADGTYGKWMNKLTKTNLLVIDDLGLAPMTETDRTNLLEVIEDRYGSGSTIISSQLPVEHWHENIGDPTIADAIVDRLFHNAYKINLKGDSMRKKKPKIDSTRDV